MNQEKPLRLLIVTDYFYPHWTGLSKSLLYLVESLQQRYQITVLTIQHDRKLPLQENKDGAHIFRVPYLFALSRAKFSIKIFIQLISLLPQTDVVFVNSPSIHILGISLITKLFHKKLIIFHQGDLILPKGITNFIVEKVFDFATYISCLIADVLSTYTQDYANNSRVLKPFLKKVRPMLLPVVFAKTEEKHSNLTTIRIAKKKYVLFGFAGRFVEEKGFDILFKAIPDIVKNIPTARFVFAGDLHMNYEDFFDKNKQLYEEVKKYIIITGLLNDEELAEYYDTIDYMVVPSRSDCFNLVQAEAMLHGVPIIASNIPGLRFLVTETGYGILFEKENSEDLAKKCIFLYTNKKSIQNKRDNVKQVLNTPKNVAKITTIIG